MSAKMEFRVKRFSPDFYNRFHDWEVIASVGEGRFLHPKWSKDNPEEFERPEDQYEAMIDFVRGCQFSNTEYNVFMDGELTDL